MCGIHLQVLLKRTSSVGNCDCSIIFREGRSSQNVERRGPDVLSEPLVVQRGANVDVDVDGADGCEVSLQATVLQMRQECIGQPVVISDSNKDTITGENDGGSSYLCWNGEVYQVLSPTKSDHDNDNNNNNNNESTSLRVDDVWQYDQSDTMLVTDMISPLLLGRSLDDVSSLSHEISNTLSRLINAEFAFLLLTQDAVYYARDVWGRRSLLYWECPICGSFRIASVATKGTVTTARSKDEAVAADDDKASNNNNSAGEESPCNTTFVEWSEIEPGQVMEYRFDTNTLSVVSFSTHFKDLSETLMSIPPKLQVTLSPSPSPSPTIPRPEGVSDEMWNSSFLLEAYLTSAVTMRLDYNEARSPAAILFSGGLDSVVLAALTIQTMASQQQNGGTNGQTFQQPRSIFLYNVSFGPDYKKSADRKAALISYQTLQELFPDQHIVFKDIVVSWEEIAHHEPHIRELLAPKTTIMDVNIATALWFASRGIEGGEGESSSTSSSDDPTKDDYHVPRVLLVGMGADEQLGGYGRHRKAFQKNGWDGLREELNMDQSRLWERNLGRDDRICADHGKEARFPYLDPRVVQLLQDLPLERVCDFELPPGQGDKRLLRLVATRMGLDHASGLVKRAIQFGSRISHVSDTKRFGSRRQAKGQTVIPS